MKVWHISDTHLSFDAEGNVTKPMNLRTWSKGSWTYEGYLERMARFATDNMSQEDIILITGDVTHDISGKKFIHSVNWLRANLPGTLVLIRGNHDLAMSIGLIRTQLPERTHFIEEDSIYSVGPFVIGCVSDHKNYDVAPDLIEQAENVVRRAIQWRKTPILMCHYPLTDTNYANALGQVGIKGFFSGHIHVTIAGGVDPEWYDKSAKQTDDQTFEGCFFSTGTTDTLLWKHGKSFKDVSHVVQTPIEVKSDPFSRDQIAELLNSRAGSLDHFSRKDPFNPQNTVSGFINRLPGKMSGSLVITEVNGMMLQKPFLVKGTPKLVYPYKSSNSTDLIDFTRIEGIASYQFQRKWNGMNVLAFRYPDASGEWFISAKSKGTPFLSNVPGAGSFLALVQEHLATNNTDLVKLWMSHLPKELSKLSEFHLYGISFELCGRKEPHLVKYDFDLDLKPLFFILDKGIRPILIDTSHTDPTIIPPLIESAKFLAEAENFDFSMKTGLPLDYEYERFAEEGYVLYTLDKNGFVINDTMYKIKPPSIEEVHWHTFEKDIKGRVREAIVKIVASEQLITPANLQAELDMGPKQWSKWGEEVMKFAKSGVGRANQKIVLLCGLPGAGKSTLADFMVDRFNFKRICQDEHNGKKQSTISAYQKALDAGCDIVVDRCNFDEHQRSTWIAKAVAVGVSLDNIHAVYLDTPKEKCLERVAVRTEHPTFDDLSVEERHKVVEAFAKIMALPMSTEGISKIWHINDSSDPKQLEAFFKAMEIK